MGSGFITCSIGYPLESWKRGRVGGTKTLGVSNNKGFTSFSYLSLKLIKRMMNKNKSKHINDSNVKFDKLISLF